MRIAYLVLVHANPGQLLRLVNTLPADSPIFIHVDARTPASVYAEMQLRLSERDVKPVFVRRHACRWGDIGIVRATMEMIRHAADLQFDYATLLSGADYPIKSNDEIAHRLSLSDGAEYIEAKAADAHAQVDQQKGLYQADLKLSRYHLRIRSRVFPTPWIRRIPEGMKAFGGSQWWTLSHAAIRHIADFDKAKPTFMRFCTNSFIPDESAIQTILGNSPFASKITQNKQRCVIWDRPEPPYPATLVSSDFDMLSNSGDFFARKFDPSVDSAILDRIDTELLQGRGANERAAAKTIDD